MARINERDRKELAVELDRHELEELDYFDSDPEPERQELLLELDCPANEEGVALVAERVYSWVQLSGKKYDALVYARDGKVYLELAVEVGFYDEEVRLMEEQLSSYGYKFRVLNLSEEDRLRPPIYSDDKRGV